MTIHFTFWNIPRGGQHFTARVEPSIADFLFEFNLGVHTPNDPTWITATQGYTPGRDAGTLEIQGRQGQDVFVMIRDANGMEKRIKYSIDDYWVDGGDIGTGSVIADYRAHFEESLGISSEHMYCQALHGEYQNLEVDSAALTFRPGDTVQAQQIDPQDLMRRKILAKEIVQKCESYFTNLPEEWHEIELDSQD